MAVLDFVLADISTLSGLAEKLGVPVKALDLVSLTDMKCKRKDCQLLAAQFNNGKCVLCSQSWFTRVIDLNGKGIINDRVGAVENGEEGRLLPRWVNELSFIQKHHLCYNIGCPGRPIKGVGICRKCVAHMTAQNQKRMKRIHNICKGERTRNIKRKELTITAESNVDIGPKRDVEVCNNKQGCRHPIKVGGVCKKCLADMTAQGNVGIRQKRDDKVCPNDDCSGHPIEGVGVFKNCVAKMISQNKKNHWPSKKRIREMSEGDSCGEKKCKTGTSESEIDIGIGQREEADNDCSFANIDSATEFSTQGKDLSLHATLHLCWIQLLMFSLYTSSH